MLARDTKAYKDCQELLRQVVAITQTFPRLTRYTIGQKAIGVVIKPHRVYVANRTIGRSMQRLRYFNSQRPSAEGAKRLQASVNSYLGLMRQHRAYGRRVQLCKAISPEWYKYVAVVNNYEKIKTTIYGN